jgi:thiamine-monophosphate kinase
MKLSALGEFGLIQSIQKRSSRRAPGVVLGIGDDAAAFKVSAAALQLATTDMLVEGVHFDLSFTDYFSLGWKSAAANLSDIAAMGGLPRFCLTSLALPPRISVEHIAKFYSGFSKLLAAHKTVLTGGDTCFSQHDLIISVTVLGEVHKNTMVTRAGAQAGDKIFVTNTLGDSAAGLELLKAGVGRQKSEVRSKVLNSALIQRHLRPVPRVAWGRKIAISGCATAMIDVSDGLSSDLSHICGQSRVGAVVYSDKVPFSRMLLSAVDTLKNTPLRYALSGGEDYELLFTTPPAKIKKLLSLDIPLTEIGEITRSRRLIIVDGKNRGKKLRPTGYNHFARSAL